jgi:hypothetical protein
MVCLVTTFPPDRYVILQNLVNKMMDVLYIFLPPFFFPQGGNDWTPSPVGEAREGGLTHLNVLKNYY